VIFIEPVQLRVDPAEAQRDLDGLVDADRLDPARLLRVLQPEAGLAVVVGLQPALELLRVGKRDDRPAVLGMALCTA
jgi:hypothetical protein